MWWWHFKAVGCIDNALEVHSDSMSWGYHRVTPDTTCFTGLRSLGTASFSTHVLFQECTRLFKYDRDLCGLFTHISVPVIFEPPCTSKITCLLPDPTKLWRRKLPNLTLNYLVSCIGMWIQKTLHCFLRVGNTKNFVSVNK
jgi:hypothetical protein